MNDNTEKLKYNLDDPLSKKELWVYGLQHLIYFAAGTIILPIAVGMTLGLDQAGIASLLQRTFLLCGIVSLLQVMFGHKYPIVEGPAGLWGSMLIIMGTSAADTGISLETLRSSLQTGFMIAGAVIMIIAATGLIHKISKLFTPIVNGVIIVLMVLQISSTFVSGMLGINQEGDAVDSASFFIFLLTAGIILFTALYAKGFLQSIATLFGVTVGWIAAALAGFWSVQYGDVSIISLPKIWAWGTPTLDFGIVVSCVIGSIFLLSMSFASISSMGEVVKENPSRKKIGSSIFIHGFASFLSGIFPVIPFMPFVSSTGVVIMTGVASRKPFALAGFFMILFGFIGPVSTFFASMPQVVAYSTSIIIFSLIIGQGLKEFRKVPINSRESYIIGIAFILGVGVMFLPKGAFDMLPQTVSLILSNGLLVGTITALVLEQGLRLQRSHRPHSL